MRRTIFLVLVLIYGAKSENDETPSNLLCCPEGFTNKYKDGTVMCTDTNNVTMSIRLKCNETMPLFNFTINENNQIEIPIHPLYSTVIESHLACVITTKNNGSKTKKALMICLDEEENAFIDDTVLGYCIIVSVVFLSITTIIYCILEELRDLMGKSIINFCGSSAIGMALLCTIKLMSYTDMDHCAARGFLAYFFFLAAFFWTTSISVQVLLSTRMSSIVDRGWREFAYFALFSWGCPAILTMITAIVNYLPGKHERPGIGLNHCWFFNTISDKTQQWIYMYSIMTILITVNIAIFIYTSTIIWRLSFASSHIKAIRYKFNMTMRLLILMGLPWIFEMISSVCEKHVIWAITDVFNTLQGILIFLLLVVFRKKTIKSMYRRGWLDCISGVVERYLAVGDDDEENAIQHTDVPMNDKSVAY